MPPARCAAVVVQEAGVEGEIRAGGAVGAQPPRGESGSTHRRGRAGAHAPASHILRIFDEVLVPAAALQPGANTPRPWNVSLGTALADWPLIHAALLILELACGELPVERASVLLRSPFMGGAGAKPMHAHCWMRGCAGLGIRICRCKRWSSTPPHEAASASAAAARAGLARLRARLSALPASRSR